MVVMRVKGLNKATKRLADGRKVTYWYAWRHGPRLRGAPGSPEFIESYAEAEKSRKRRPEGSLAFLVASYRESELGTKAASTQREKVRWLDRISEDLGTLPVEALDELKVKKHFRIWRDKWKSTPRQADYGIQVLSALLSWAVEAGEIETNFALKIGKLYEGGDRADLIWEEEEVAAYRKWAPSPEVGFIVPLACLTGLRRTDLASLLWAEANELYMSKSTAKSRGRRTATVPILPETAALLKEIRDLQASACYKDGPPATVLANTRGKPWTPSGLTHAVAAFKGKRLHDCRGTFATRLRLAGWTAPQIADAMGWEEKRVERLLSVYVDRDRIVRELAERMGRT